MLVKTPRAGLRGSTQVGATHASEASKLTSAGVNAHNHQHLFCLRAHANINGPNNTVFVSDTNSSDAPVGGLENFYGNAFGVKRTKLATEGESATDYDSSNRTWDICNTNRVHPRSGNPSNYKMVSRQVPLLLPKEGSLVWKRASFARHAVYVTKYVKTISDD